MRFRLFGLVICGALCVSLLIGQAHGPSLSVMVLAVQPVAKSPETAQPLAPARVPPEEIEKLVKMLGSDNAMTREAATKAILKIGDDALPHLEVAMTPAPNLELKRRTEILYAEISAKAPSPNLPDGVIHVRLPPGTFDMKPIKLNGKPMIRILVGKTIIETERFFFGDRWGCEQFEAIGDIIHWMPPKGGMGDRLAGMSKEPGAGYFSQSYVPLDQLKSGSLLVTSPSFVFRWGKDAISGKYHPSTKHVD
jgi:hypothetical protein